MRQTGASTLPSIRVKITVVMKRDMAPWICSRLTSEGMLAASAGANTCPTELNRKVITSRGHAWCWRNGASWLRGISTSRPARSRLVSIISERLSWRSAYTPAGAESSTPGKVKATATAATAVVRPVRS